MVMFHMIAWHTISIAPGKAFVVERALSAVNIQTYAPHRTVRHGRMTVEVPWLGGLILARWDGADAHLWHEVRNIIGVSAILGGWPPWSISDAEVDRFRARVDELSDGGIVDPAPCSVGDAVRFSYLSFHQLESRCLWVGGGVVGVRIRMLGHDHILQVPYAFVDVI